MELQKLGNLKKRPFWSQSKNVFILNIAFLMHAVGLLQIRHPETSAHHKSKAMYSGLTHCNEFRISWGCTAQSWCYNFQNHKRAQQGSWVNHLLVKLNWIVLCHTKYDIHIKHKIWKKKTKHNYNIMLINI